VRSFHSSRVLVAVAGVLVAATSLAQPAPSHTESVFTIFMRGVPIGTETVAVGQTAGIWTISSSGRSSAPIDYFGREVRFRYASDWRPLELTIDAQLRGESLVGRTTITGTSARNVVTQAGRPGESTVTIAPDSLLLPSPVWGSFEALTRRLGTIPAGATVPAYSLQGNFAVQIGQTSEETLQTTTRTIRVRRTPIKLVSNGPPVDAEVWRNDADELLRLTIPAQMLDVIRDDISSVAVRRVVVSRPNDEEIRVAANGFKIAGTLSKPNATSPLRKLPVVILVGGSTVADRDELTSGIAIFGELANALADAGFMTVRYDKRGVGQSGGRPESATLEDFTDDLLAVVKFVRARKDVDSDHVALVGYGEGSPVAMLGARKTDNVDALVLVAASGVAGSELNLWQVSHALERSNRPESERQATLTLQKQIQNAAITDTGWEAIPPALRKQAESPLFKSQLAFDPATVLPKLDQPVLVVQGALDTQLPPANAETLERLVSGRKNRPSTLVKVPGVNHLLTPAQTGEVDEYTSLADPHVSREVSRAIGDWLTTTFAAVR